MGRRKKKRSKPVAEMGRTSDSERKVVEALVAAFALASVEEVAAAVREAGGDADKAAEILAAAVLENGLENGMGSGSSSSCSNVADDSSSMSVGSSGCYGLDSSSTSSEGFKELMEERARELRGKGKKVVASTGTVSTVLGKEYVRLDLKKSGGKGKGFSRNNGVVDRDEAEQFLCSILGDQPELSLAVVRDVLGCYAYDVEKALDALLRMCGSLDEQTNDGTSSRLLSNDEFWTDISTDLTSQSSDKEDALKNICYGNRSYFGVLSSDSNAPTGERTTELELPQAVLESLFKVPKSPNRDPHTMNWRKVVKKLESIGKLSEPSEVPLKEPAKGDEYQFFRKSATQHWESTRSCYQKAASAYSKGEKSYAAYLSDEGKAQTRIARVADEKASQQIFNARNKNIGNVITIDLHGQHVKQAMKLLKLHLLFGSYACCKHLIVLKIF
uniref:DUF1771 domain-containing protein n=1 Tax=Kalanchoe fedtschenkoi TaxID=63787 RepID=A0A7N0TGN0_KALFE